jgi:hypothetical protein
MAKTTEGLSRMPDAAAATSESDPRVPAQQAPSGPLGQIKEGV